MSTSDVTTADPTGRVVVALDGSASSIRALRQGARIASAMRLRLEAVTVWHRSELYGYPGLPLDFDTDALRSAAEATQARAVDVVFAGSPPARFVGKVLEGPVVTTLLTEAEGAEMLVLGSRGHGGFAGLVLGSVSAACAAHASCPVLVHHSEQPVAEEGQRRTGRERRAHGAKQQDVVVGIDGTRASLGALRQGAQFAESLQLPLLAICAADEAASPALDATAMLARASEEVFGRTPPRWYRSSVRQGTPAAVLGTASETARMLVIGHSSGTPTMARESVSSAIALEAVCPVVIFHSTRVAREESLDGSPV